MNVQIICQKRIIFIISNNRQFNKEIIRINLLNKRIMFKISSTIKIMCDFYHNNFSK